MQRLGVKLDPEYVQRVRSSEQSRIEARRRERERRKAAATPAEFDGDSDERFAYIAGYTAWGFPYGVTWEEMERSEGEPWESNAVDMDCEPPEDGDDCDEGIPF